MLIFVNVIKKGSKGTQVAQLQNALNQLGYNCGLVDGIFGNGVDKAVRSFQRANGLVVDGIIGRASIDKLNELLGVKNDKPISNTKPTTKIKSIFYKKGDVSIIETTADNIEIKILGNTLANAKVFGVNGTFYNTPQATLAASCWAIATNNGQPIGGNSMVNNYQNVKRGTVVFYKDGTMDVVLVNSISEFTKPHQWSIGGYSVYPYFNLSAEKCPSSVNYKTSHTFLAYKGNKVYLMVKPNCMIKDIIPLVKEMGLDGAIALDGGGSSQLRHPNGNITSSRKINSAVLLKDV